MRFIITAQGSFGDINPCAGIATRLRQLGHEVVFLTSEYYAPLLNELGIELVSTFSREEHLKLTSSPDMIRPLKGFRFLFRQLVLAPARREYEAIRDLYVPGKTAVLVRGPSVAARIAHEKLGVPMATLIMSPEWLFSTYRPGPFGQRLVPEGVRRLMQLPLRRGADVMMAPETNRLRGELGLPPLDRPYANWIYSPQLMLGLFPDWFAPPRPDWPPMRLAGFPHFDGSPAQKPLAGLEQFLQSGEPPVIVSAVSWMGMAGQFFQRSVAALGRIGARAILLSPFPQNVPPGLPREIAYFGYVPLSQILSRAAGIVHQGGVGTVAAALRAGIPQVIVPVNLMDGPFNGFRIKALGVGDYMWPFQYRPWRAARTIQKMFSAPSIRQKCREYATRTQEQDGLGEACRAILATFCAGN